MSTPEPDASLDAANARIAAALAPLIDERERAILARLPALSNQERAVWALMGHGMRPKAIAWELAISPKTAETHLARLRAKLAGGDPATLDTGDLAFLARLWVRADGGGGQVEGEEGGRGELPDVKAPAPGSR